MQEPLTIIVIGLITIAIAIALALFGIRIGRSRHKGVIDSVPKPAVLPRTKEFDTAIPQANSSDSSSETTQRAKQGEPLAQVPPKTDLRGLIIPPILESSGTPAPVPNEEEQKDEQETIHTAEPETTEQPKGQFAEPLEDSSDESTQPLEESTGVLPSEETPVTHEPTPTRKQMKLAPENRGGARRGKRTNETEEPRAEKKEHVRKPELVCWQQSRKWFLGIETLIEKGETYEFAAMQANVQLTKVLDSRWTISELFETITITTLPTNEKWELQLAEKQKPFLLFKLSGENLSSGRRVRYATSGIYLVVAPEDWIRDEKQSGVPQVTPSLCHLNGYQAHYFHLDSSGNERIVLLTPNHEEIRIPNRNSHFDLAGCKIEDANDEMGQLFGQRPPFLVANDASILRDVETIVIGDEGKSANGWRIWFKPEVRDGQVDLLPHLHGKDAGWFYVRIYDSNDELIDSLDFRFARSLHAISIDEHSALPSETGHKPVRITVECDDAYSCKLLPAEQNLKAETISETKVEIGIPPQPEYDKTDWVVVSSSKEKVKISALVERVWWTVCRKNIPINLSQWQDKSLVLKFDRLKTTSDYVLRIRFPKPRWVREARIGFELRRARAYPIEVMKHTVDIPLNHLEGVSQLEDSSKDHPLFLWLAGFSEQIIALLATERRRRKSVQQNGKVQVRLNISRLLKYLNRLDRGAEDASLSKLLDECRKKWHSAGIREHRDTYLVETACVIALSWKVLKAKRMKVIGRRKGWIRFFVATAESNPSSFDAIVDKYKVLVGSDKVTS